MCVLFPFWNETVLTNAFLKVGYKPVYCTENIHFERFQKESSQKFVLNSQPAFKLHNFDTDVH